MKPAYSDYIVDKSYSTYYIDISIKNNGSKTLTVGGTGDDFGLYYPYGGTSTYYTAFLLDSNYNRVNCIAIAPGERVTVHFEMNSTHYILSGSRFVFLIVYDGIKYMDVATPDGEGWFEAYED